MEYFFCLFLPLIWIWKIIFIVIVTNDWNINLTTLHLLNLSIFSPPITLIEETWENPFQPRWWRGGEAGPQHCLGNAAKVFFFAKVFFLQRWFFFAKVSSSSFSFNTDYWHILKESEVPLKRHREGVCKGSLSSQFVTFCHILLILSIRHIL